MSAVTVRIPFRAGFLAWAQVKHALAWAAAHDVQVEVYTTGRVVRQGWLVASGQESRVQAFHRLLSLMAR